MNVKEIFKPTGKRILIAFLLSIVIYVLDLFTGYCSGDMCFSGIYRLTGDSYYDIGSKIIMYSIFILWAYVIYSIVYGLILILKSKIKK